MNFTYLLRHYKLFRACALFRCLLCIVYIYCSLLDFKLELSTNEKNYKLSSSSLYIIYPFADSIVAKGRRTHVAKLGKLGIYSHLYYMYCFHTMFLVAKLLYNYYVRSYVRKSVCQVRGKRDILRL